MEEFDAARIETDDKGNFIMVAKTVYSRALGRPERAITDYWRLDLPERFADIVAEARRTNHPLRAYYQEVFGPVEADLVELV